jgi:hypothetical protein
MITIVEALHSLRPGANWVIYGDTLKWADNKQTQPTEEEIAMEISRLQTEYDNKEYQRKRFAEYPSIRDQLDTIFHGGLDAWKAQIQAVKDKYPKG